VDDHDHESTTSELLDQTGRLLIQSRQLLAVLDTQIARTAASDTGQHR
jgi:hypothetical protein